MCSRKDNLTSEFLTVEVAAVMLPEIWPVLMTRHGGCNPSEACVIDACLRSSQARVGDGELTFHQPLYPEVQEEIYKNYMPGPQHTHKFDQPHGFCKCGHLKETAGE